jgi:hypothetical protein
MAAEAPVFEITSVRPVGAFMHADISGVSAKCHLCLRRLTDSGGSRQSGDVVVHTPCQKSFHDACLTSYFTRNVPSGGTALQCPSCKANWAGDKTEHFNVFMSSA